MSAKLTHVCPRCYVVQSPANRLHNKRCCWVCDTLDHVKEPIRPLADDEKAAMRLGGQVALEELLRSKTDEA